MSQRTATGAIVTKTLRQVHLKAFEETHAAADAALSRKDPEAIVPVLKAALRVNADVGRGDMRDWAYDQLGRCYSAIGRHKAALECHLAELEAVTSAGDVVEEGHACCNIARAYVGLKEYVGRPCVLFEVTRVLFHLRVCVCVCVSVCLCVRASVSVCLCTRVSALRPPQVDAGCGVRAACGCDREESG